MLVRGMRVLCLAGPQCIVAVWSRAHAFVSLGVECIHFPMSPTVKHSNVTQQSSSKFYINMFLNRFHVARCLGCSGVAEILVSADPPSNARRVCHCVLNEVIASVCAMREAFEHFVCSRVVFETLNGISSSERQRPVCSVLYIDVC